MRLLFAFVLISLATACSHPLEIVGQGDIESSTGTNDCSLEDQPCSNVIAGDYDVTYTAVPRDGWSFVEWQGCGDQFPDCYLSVPGSVVDKYWLRTMPALRAVFVQGLGPGVPAIIVGSVRGNTVQFGSAAEFSVSLNTEPTDDVTFFVTSTDRSEGLPEVSEFTFTPANWNQQQAVVVRGQNGAPDDHVQDYQITFGFTMSADDAYDGLYTPPVAMKGLSLELANPPQPINLLSNIETQQSVDYQYTGYSSLTFGLTDSPTGMIIDTGSGYLTWTPQPSDEGQTFPVTVTATDGVVSDEVTFDIGVFQPEPLTVVASTNSVTVQDSGSDLNGLSITNTDASEPDANVSGLSLLTIPIEDAPTIPSWITPLSDVMVVPEALGQAVELRFPVGDLPEGVKLDDVEIYIHLSASSGEDSSWMPVSYNYYYEGSVVDPVYVAHLNGLLGMAFIGYQQVSPPEQEGSQMVTSVAKTAVEPDVICEAQPNFFGGGLNYDEHICIAPQIPELKIIVEDFGKTTRWGGTDVEELARWVKTARAGIHSLALVSDDEITVKIRHMENPAEFGKVNTTNFRGLFADVLILSDAQLSQGLMKTTTLHELFHNGQIRTISGGPHSLLWNATAKWLTEGTAVWFSDFVDDTANAYRKEKKAGLTPIEPILENGLPSLKGVGKENAYHRYAFFKLLSEKCIFFGSTIRDLVNAADGHSNISGLQGLASQLGSNGAVCNFGGHLGSAKSASLEAALVYYQYATLHEGDMSLLDLNEGRSSNDFTRTDYQFSQDGSSWTGGTVDDWDDRGYTSPLQLSEVKSIPPAGAYSFTVPFIRGDLAEDALATLKVDSSSELIVSMRSENQNFIPQNSNAGDLEGRPHDWFSTSDTSEYLYGTTEGVPELFVTVVNPSLTETATVDVSFDLCGSGAEGGSPGEEVEGSCKPINITKVSCTIEQIPYYFDPQQLITVKRWVIEGTARTASADAYFYSGATPNIGHAIVDPPLIMTECSDWTGTRISEDGSFAYCSRNPGDPVETSWTTSPTPSNTNFDTNEVYARLYHSDSSGPVVSSVWKPGLSCPGVHTFE